MIERTLVVGPFQCNCRLIACPQTGRAVLIDPGDEPDRINQWVAAEAAQFERAHARPMVLTSLLHTHAHLDHIGGTRGVREATPSAPRIALHAGDAELYRRLVFQGEMFGINYEEPLPVEHWIEDGESITVGELTLEVRHIPGHSPGSVALYLERGAPLPRVYTGDTLFRESVGRTDLWGADTDTMFRSIRERLLTLDDDTHVCPGHGPDSSVGHERRQNPFLR